MECHADMEDPPEYSFHLLRRHKFAMDRQISEALAIEREENQISMNNKAEFGRNFIPRMMLDPDTSAWEDAPKSKSNQKSQQKRDANGFTINQNSRTQPTTHSEKHEAMFSSQYKQRKRRRIETNRLSARSEMDRADQSRTAEEVQAQQEHPTGPRIRLKPEQQSNANVKPNKQRINSNTGI